MAAGALISVEEYLRTNYEPNCDYIDGVLRQKSMPTRKHARIQARLAELLARWHDFEANTELTVQIREGKWLVPDLTLQELSCVQDPYPTEPVFLCVEILSPDDRVSEVFAKCEDYLAWGVETTWIVDPEAQLAWEYRGGGRPMQVREGGALHAGPVSIPLADLFSVLN